ncbi:MAG: 3',5'-cyclic-nucleotide phosphodiesterase [Helicobacteraceae bacterium]|jgi:cAMP phosphodiesterase|nr:3',5'-cyclic-nucleotide phosphodiesterase [Helicobacteraceae bacterium]
MKKVIMLGAHGGRNKGKATTSLLLSESVAIDAGNLLAPLGREARRLNHIFLSHCHMDHIFDLPFLIEAFFVERTKPINIYGLSHTLDMLKAHIFNGKIWPNFNDIFLLNSEEHAINFCVIEPNKSYVVDNLRLTPYETVHTVPSVGYLIEKGARKLIFTADTCKCENTWKIINATPEIKTLITEVSFPSGMEQLAYKSGHLTPKLLNEELSNLKRNDVKVYVCHFKPDFVDLLYAEMQHFERTKLVKFLDDETEIEI